ncbi:glycosyltransferase family A protein [Leptothoe sp. LEGE 181152]|nr:glycosyltransferase family A protein [Leptothoe sp. LEGE 181152]
MELAEVRIPTYKRPDLLKRSIQSLIDQDYPHWRAIVMDDSLAQEAKAVVESFADSRLIYRPNPKNLGSAGNLDQAFTTNSLLGGTYACVLEDDNWLLPTYLSENIAVLRANNVKLLLRNQAIWQQTEYDARPTDRTTRGDWFTSKIYSPLEFYAYLFFFEGASNGGLFWHTEMQSQLQVGPTVKDAGLQEYCRALQIIEPFKFEPKPLCCWAEMTSSLSLRNPADNRTFARGVQSIKQHLLKKYGTEMLLEIEAIALSLDKNLEFEISLADALFPYQVLQTKGILRKIKQYLKSYTRSIWIENPLEDYLHA